MNFMIPIEVKWGPPFWPPLDVGEAFLTMVYLLFCYSKSELHSHFFQSFCSQIFLKWTVKALNGMREWLFSKNTPGFFFSSARVFGQLLIFFQHRICTCCNINIITLTVRKHLFNWCGFKNYKLQTDFLPLLFTFDVSILMTDTIS